MTTPDIPLLDISAWRHGTERQRERIAARMDRALRQSGFLLIENHGVPAGLRQRIRAEAGKFFALPPERKRAYATAVGGRGWIPQGGEANAFYGEVADPARADLKESITNGRDFLTGDAAMDEQWFAANVWPAECPGLAALAGEFTEQARGLYYDLLRMGAVALGLDEDTFVARVLRGPQTFNINRYPPLSATGQAKEGQFRVAPHTDWGILTILDRQPGYGGLQVQALDGTWADAPYVPDAFTVNVADLLSRWTGERWRSTRHRVLPPPGRAPDEELISLIVFLEAEMDTMISPVAGHRELAPVVAGDWYRARESAATVASA
ncbi:MAG TPA: 2-oxoglutarate and iron-dependent oxygenase domain-containing protein [Candidatus Acidoferrales bacterium]|jgi:isopenicillin N synthase-like dioxygenase|nr:2-oxoglutarate and iron-dependent oxygenase domain-containing protein [Candidatus Acidoferrales bacterium]